MAQVRYALRDGDGTSTGGTVVADSSFLFSHHGKTVALEGAIATCPACESQGPVHNDCVPNFIFMGRRLLVSGARVYCKCAESPWVIPSQRNFTIEVQSGTAGAPSAINAVGTAPVSEQGSLASTVAGFNERFVLRDSLSKTPLANIEYALRRSDGSLEFGSTDAGGHTHLLSSTVESEEIEIYVEGEK